MLKEQPKQPECREAQETNKKAQARCVMDGLLTLEEIVKRNSILFTSDEAETIQSSLQRLQEFIEGWMGTEEVFGALRRVDCIPPYEELKLGQATKQHIDEMLQDLDGVGSFEEPISRMRFQPDGSQGEFMDREGDLLLKFNALLVADPSPKLQSIQSVSFISKTRENGCEVMHNQELQEELNSYKQSLTKFKELHRTNMSSLEAICTDYEHYKHTTSAKIEALESLIRQQQAKISCLESQLELKTLPNAPIDRVALSTSRAEPTSPTDKRLRSQPQRTDSQPNKTEKTSSPLYSSVLLQKRGETEASTAPGTHHLRKSSIAKAADKQPEHLKVSRFDVCVEMPDVRTVKNVGKDESFVQGRGPNEYQMHPQRDSLEYVHMEDYQTLSFHQDEVERLDTDRDDDLLLPKRLLQTPAKGSLVSRAVNQLSPVSRLSHTFYPVERPLVRLVHSNRAYGNLPEGLQTKILNFRKQNLLEQTCLEDEGCADAVRLWDLHSWQQVAGNEAGLTSICVIVGETIPSLWLKHVLQNFLSQDDTPVTMVTQHGRQERFQLNSSMPTLGIDESVALVAERSRMLANLKGVSVNKMQPNACVQSETRLVLLIPASEFERAFARATEHHPRSSAVSHHMLRVVLQRVFSKHFKQSFTPVSKNKQEGNNPYNPTLEQQLDGQVIWEADVVGLYYLNIDWHIPEPPVPKLASSAGRESDGLVCQRLTDILYLIQAERGGG